MTSTDLWPLVQQERLRFADLLATLTPDDWTTPSLAAGWTVKDVAAHSSRRPTPRRSRS